MTELSKSEMKEIINLSAAASALKGFLCALEDTDLVTASYVNRLNDYYIVNLEKAVKVFVDKLAVE